MGSTPEDRSGGAKAAELLARLDQNSEHFARMPVDSLDHAAGTAVRVIRSILGCGQALVLLLDKSSSVQNPTWRLRAQSGCKVEALGAPMLDDLVLRLAHAPVPVSTWNADQLPDELLEALERCGVQVPLMAVALRRLADLSDEVFAICVAGGAAEGEAGFDGHDQQALHILGSVLSGTLLYCTTRGQLLAAKEEAEVAGRAKTEFLAAMSHELRTPMNGIMVMAHLLAEAGLEERYQRMSDVITRSSESLLSLIDDILDFSQAEHEQLRIERYPFSLGDLIQEVVSRTGQSTKDNGVELRVDVPAELPDNFVGDAKRIRQVLQNLLSNAVKFTREGSVLVQVRSQPADGPGLRLHLEVRDTGIGIREDWLEKIFDRFTQVDSSATRMVGGSGLGLAICQKLVRAMGGRIGVESVHGEGSTFWFEIDVEPGPAAESQPGTHARGVPGRLGDQRS